MYYNFCQNWPWSSSGELHFQLLNLLLCTLINILIDNVEILFLWMCVSTVQMSIYGSRLYMLIIELD